MRYWHPRVGSNQLLRQATTVTVPGSQQRRDVGFSLNDEEVARALRGIAADFKGTSQQMRDTIECLARCLDRNAGELSELRAQLRRAVLDAETDPLTGLANRRGLASVMSHFISESILGAGDSLLYLDVDHFKSLNDRYGHGVGDLALTCIADEIRKVINVQDLAARIGGDEFVAILRNTELQDAAKVATQLCSQIAQSEVSIVERGAVEHLSVSIGVAPVVRSDVSTALKLADSALCAAKQGGRDRVCIAGCAMG